jgi:hypothetical protein
VELPDHVAQVDEHSEDTLAGLAQDRESRIAVGQQHIVAVHDQPRFGEGDTAPKASELGDDAPQSLQGHARPPEFCHGAQRYYVKKRVPPAPADARFGRREARRKKA